jgi:hypothetical protein
MIRLLALAVALLAAPFGLYGCAPHAIPVEASCQSLGLHVRVLDGQLAQERLVLGAAARQNNQPASSLHLATDPPDDPSAAQTRREQAGDLDAMQSRVADHEAALADARTLAVQCRG